MTEFVAGQVLDVATFTAILATGRPREEREANVGEHDVGVDDVSVQRPHIGAGDLTGVRVGAEDRDVSAVVADAGVVDPTAVPITEWALGPVAPGVECGLERFLCVVDSHGTVLRIQKKRDRRRRPLAERAVRLARCARKHHDSDERQRRGESSKTIHQ